MKPMTARHMGTIKYLSPEQVAREKVEHRTDIWSLGSILYEMCTSRLPFDHDDAIICAILDKSPLPHQIYIHIFLQIFAATGNAYW
jgi:serine/threonine-protein kinase